MTGQEDSYFDCGLGSFKYQQSMPISYCLRRRDALRRGCGDAEKEHQEDVWQEGALALEPLLTIAGVFMEYYLDYQPTLIRHPGLQATLPGGSNIHESTIPDHMRSTRTQTKTELLDQYDSQYDISTDKNIESQEGPDRLDITFFMQPKLGENCLMPRATRW